ncbi:prepilin-type N-terminal cleavage/methylation domain-containing protein [Chloroflexota bacterium]
MNAAYKKPVEIKRTIMKTIKGSRKFTLPKSLANRERGFAIVEVLVALALLGIAGVCFLASLTTVSKSTITTDEHSTGDSMAISQMEYIFSQSYDDTNNPPQYALLTEIPERLSINVISERLDPENDGVNDDDGIQEISVIVNIGSEQLVSLTSRKVIFAYEP